MKKEYNTYKNCETFDEWLSKSGGYPHMDYEITEPIDISLGVGAIDYEGNETIRGKDERIIEVNIDSWIGISSGARHIYAKLVIPNVTSIDKNGHSISRSGYGVPNYISGWSIHITKELDQKAKDLDLEGHPADTCFDDMDIGEPTTRFEKYEEDLLITRINEVFNKWFTGGWVLKINK